MKYVLLKMPSGEIRIVDNNTHIGKKKVEKLCSEGAVSAGAIESDLHPGQLKRGISHEARGAYEVEREKLWNLRKFIAEL